MLKKSSIFFRFIYNLSVLLSDWLFYYKSKHEKPQNHIRITINTKHIVMQNKLQELTDRLYNEGLSKGKQEGEELLAKAKSAVPSLCSLPKSGRSAI